MHYSILYERSWYQGYATRRDGWERVAYLDDLDLEIVDGLDAHFHDVVGTEIDLVIEPHYEPLDFLEGQDARVRFSRIGFGLPVISPLRIMGDNCEVALKATMLIHDYAQDKLLIAERIRPARLRCPLLNTESGLSPAAFLPKQDLEAYERALEAKLGVPPPGIR